MEPLLSDMKATKMTMPSERTRALRWAHELLHEVGNGAVGSAKDSDRAQALLGDFPTTANVLAWLAGDATLPGSAASAIEQVGAFLNELRLSVSCLPEHKEQLYRVLRHYPEPGEALCWTGATAENGLHDWLQPEDFYSRK
jgi:hypothetical protein